METVQSINLSEIPIKFHIDLELPRNGGNVVCVDEETDFGKWLKRQGFIFGCYSNGDPKDWENIVIFR